MGDLFPSDPKRIRERIRRYECALKKELEEGYGGDGYGKRYLLWPLYMLVGDIGEALASFKWYEKAYPDDGGESYQYLTWALALFRGGCRQETINKLYQTMLQNLYLVPFLLGRDPQPVDMWHGSNFEWVKYAVDVPEELLNLWDDVAKQWAQEVMGHPALVEKVTRYVDIHRELNSEPPGSMRSALVNESFALKRAAIPLH